MYAQSFEGVDVGANLPALTTKPITRTTLALFAGASGDHNPIHIDIDVAKAAGMDDVFAQGMLSMAYLARMLTDWAPQSQLRKFYSRFTAITLLGDEITCKGTVVEKLEIDGKNCVRIKIDAVNQHGEVKLAGEALVALN